MAAPSVLTQPFLLTQANLPAAIPDTTMAQQRGGKYGEASVLSIVPSKHVLADEGSYFVATNPTPGTKIDYGSAGTQASFSDTVPFMVFQNTAVAGSGIRMFLDYVRLLQIGGTAPATTTSVQIAAKIDSVLRTETAGALTGTTPLNANSGSSRQPIGRVRVPNGAVATIPAATGAARLVGRAQLKGGPTLVLDEYNVGFGLVDTPPMGGYLTTVSSYWTRLAPVVLDPQTSCVLYLWLPGGATNPFSFEFETAWWER